MPSPGSAEKESCHWVAMAERKLCLETPSVAVFQRKKERSCLTVHESIIPCLGQTGGCAWPLLFTSFLSPRLPGASWKRTLPSGSPSTAPDVSATSCRFTRQTPPMRGSSRWTWSITSPSPSSRSCLSSPKALKTQVGQPQHRIQSRASWRGPPVSALRGPGVGDAWRSIGKGLFRGVL